MEIALGEEVIEVIDMSIKASAEEEQIGCESFDRREENLLDLATEFCTCSGAELGFFFRGQLSSCTLIPWTRSNRRQPNVDDVVYAAIISAARIETILCIT
jgi:hypothetical protein